MSRSSSACGPATDVVRALKCEVGDPLRSVAKFGPETLELEYVRDDVEAMYTEADFDAAHEEMVLETVLTEYMEGLFEVGSLRSTTFTFDDALMVHVPDTQYSGLFVTVDADADVDVQAVVDVCTCHVNR